MPTNHTNWLKVVASFVLLFGLYHGAEYMIVGLNSAAGFFCLHALFLAAAWAVARWQQRPGLAAWGLEFRPGMVSELAAGILMGLVLYGAVFFVSLQVGSERMTGWPELSAAAVPFGLFVFGNLFASFSEDILTRGYVVGVLRGRIGIPALVLLSATIYLLNHIYRLGDGPTAWVYLFLLGITYVIPLLLTGRLWFTGGMHWAGNSLFFLTHEIIKTDSQTGVLSPNYILAAVCVPIIALNFLVIRLLRRNKAKGPGLAQV